MFCKKSLQVAENKQHDVKKERQERKRASKEAAIV
jgi:hypothetical protein